MRILIINWRSLKDPLAGGAELATFEHAKRWVKNHNATVYWLSPPYDDKKNEVIEGVNFLYAGRPIHTNKNIISFSFKFGLFCLNVMYYVIFKLRKEVDVIIDQYHGVLFLTPLYTRKKVVVYIHEVAGDIWDKMYKFPVNKLGKLFDKLVFIPYRNKTFITVSQGTKDDLIKTGIPEQNINIVYNGVSLPIADPYKIKKEKDLTIIFLNRLVKMKGIERAIDIFYEVNKIDPKAKFWIVGRGSEEYVQKLKQKCKKLGIHDKVTFYGFVDEKTKIDLLQKAHVLLNTSYKEGWGLVNIEANSQGTPAVAFDVEGNRESIQNGQNGYTCQTQKEIITKILNINNKKLHQTTLKHANKYNWTKQAGEFYDKLSVIE